MNDDKREKQFGLLWGLLKRIGLGKSAFMGALLVVFFGCCMLLVLLQAVSPVFNSLSGLVGNQPATPSVIEQIPFLDGNIRGTPGVFRALDNWEQQNQKTGDDERHYAKTMFWQHGYTYAGEDIEVKDLDGPQGNPPPAAMLWIYDVGGGKNVFGSTELWKSIRYDKVYYFIYEVQVAENGEVVRSILQIEEIEETKEDRPVLVPW